jgi:hypothetical protein
MGSIVRSTGYKVLHRPVEPAGVLGTWEFGTLVVSLQSVNSDRSQTTTLGLTCAATSGANLAVHEGNIELAGSDSQEAPRGLFLSLSIRRENMVEKCANPACSETFDFRQGRLYFRPLQQLDSSPPANSHGVEHHWLCESCSNTYTFERRTGFKVMITPHLKALQKANAAD